MEPRILAQIALRVGDGGGVMVFVRGINGKLKLSPAIRFLGGCIFLLLMIGLTINGLTLWIIRFQEAVMECQARGGVWVGGHLPSSFCEPDQRPESDW